jgi:ABC-type hemin transport system substrate-binding protein
MMASGISLLTMTVKRRVALLGVAAAAVVAMPVTLALSAWLGGAVPFEAERAIALATTLSTIVMWLGVVRLLVAVLVFSRTPIDE